MRASRTRLTSVTVTAAVVAALTVGAVTVDRPASAATTGHAINYTYDADGRLVGESTGAGARTLSYDAVGNLTSITATAPAAVRAAAVRTAIAPTSPHAAYVDHKVVVTGSGLPATRAARIKVARLFATVLSATSSKIVVAVPRGLAGGKQTVTIESSTGRVARTSVVLPGKPAARPTPQPDLPALHAPKGVTAVAGRVRDSRTGRALGGVVLEIGEHRTRTRADGRFLLTSVPAGHHEMEIDALDLRRAGDHGKYEVGVTARRHRTVVMPWTTWLTRIDHRHSVRLPAHLHKERTLTSPALPGLEVHIPAGTVLRDDDGKRITRLSITREPLSRQPFPGAPGMTVAWTLQPGDAAVSGSGLRVVYPNLGHQAPGTRIDYVDHDADRLGLGWAVYGHGRVTKDKRHIAPDAHTRLHETYLLGVSYNPLCAYQGANCPRVGDNGKDGDPVNLQTGLFILSHTDLAMPDVLPIALTRTYRQNDYAYRSFGMGQSDAFNSFVSPDGSGNYVVQMPDGSSVPFQPTADPTVFKPVATPSALTGSTMTTDNHRNFTVAEVDGDVLNFGGETASLVSMTNRYGDSVTITRDSGGHATRVTSPNGRWIALTWGSCTSDGVQCIVSAKDNTGRVVRYAYDSSGRLITFTDAAKKVTTYSWAACADSITCTEMTAVTDPTGVAYVRNAFNSDGRVSTQTQADGTTFGFAYTVAADGHISSTTVTDPRNIQRQTIFDSNGYPSSDTVAYGTTFAQTSRVTRDAAFRVTNVVDPRGRSTTSTYDANGNMLTLTKLAGTAAAQKITFGYEPVDQRLASVTNALGSKSTFTYDDTNNTIATTDPLGHKSVTQLSDGEPVAVTDGLGNTSYMSYLDGDLVTSSDALNRSWHNYYDAAGRLLKTTDPLGNRTSYTYDSLNNLLSTTDPLGNRTASTYDPNGMVRTVTDALGHTTTYNYNAVQDLTSKTDALGKSDSYSYDADGNLASATDRLGVRDVYSYDLLNRMTSVGYKQNGTSFDSTVANTYDTGNRLTRSADSASGTINWTYDDLDRVLTETTPQGGTTYTYDAANRRTSMTVSGQTKTTYGYDTANHLTSVAGGVGTTTLAYNAADQMTSESLPGGAKQAYTYDAAGEDSGITYTSGGTTLGALTYTYDSAGRRVGIDGTYARANLPTAIGSSTYNADNELTGRAGATFTYDANGQLTSDGSTTYTWNARHQLSGLGGATTASFTYDAIGRRQTRTVGSTTTGFVYDGPNLVQERSGGTATSNLLTGLGADQTFARSDSTGTHSLLTDTLGSTIALTDGSGAVSTSYTYDPFGVPSSSGSASPNSTQYTGRENDGTGLQYNRARYYSPALERFISQDPAGQAASGVNLYAYTANMPTEATDPSGEQLLAGCAVGAVVSVGFDWLTHKLSGRKYTWGDAGRDALTGCVTGAVGGFIGEAFKAGGAAGSALSTAPDEAVFWSGVGRNGADVASSWATDNAGSTLEDTLASRGITLPEYDPVNAASVDAWRSASAEFAKNASGDVRVLLGDSVRSDSTWAQVEYPALIDNPNVTSITSINPTTGESTLLWSR